MKPGTTVGVGDGGAVGVGVSVAVATGLGLLVGVGDGADDGDVHATSIAVATSSAMSRRQAEGGLANERINAQLALSRGSPGATASYDVSIARGRIFDTAVPTGFEPAISSLTGTYARPLHHGTMRCESVLCSPRASPF